MVLVGSVRGELEAAAEAEGEVVLVAATVEVEADEVEVDDEDGSADVAAPVDDVVDELGAAVEADGWWEELDGFSSECEVGGVDSSMTSPSVLVSIGSESEVEEDGFGVATESTSIASEEDEEEPFEVESEEEVEDEFGADEFDEDVDDVLALAGAPVSSSVLSTSFTSISRI